MLQVIAFDCYGTLEDIHTDESRPCVWLTMANLMRYHGADWMPEALQSAYSAQLDAQASALRTQKGDDAVEVDLAETFRLLYAEKGVIADDALCAEAMRVFRAVSTDYFRLYPGTKEMLQSLRSAGARIALLSNAQRLFTEPELRSLGIWEDFDAIFISSDYGVKKPSKAFYQQLLDWANVPPSQIMMVGNSPTDDILCATRYGLRTAYIPSKLTGNDEPQVAHADVTLDAPDMPALTQLLLRQLAE